MARKKVKIGFDLDGVIIDKPPLIPKRILEWLVRSHESKRLAYRYPTSPWERWLRWLTHHPLFRPPIKKNLRLVRELSKNKKYKFYVISSRYSFLKERTKQWFRTYRFNGVFEAVCLNLDNEQPHIFKERKIKELGIEIFIDDDFPLCHYLSQKLPEIIIFCFEGQRHKKRRLTNFRKIESLKEVICQ